MHNTEILRDALESAGFDVPPDADIVAFAAGCIDELNEAVDYVVSVIMGKDLKTMDRTQHVGITNPVDALHWAMLVHTKTSALLKHVAAKALQ